MVMARHTQMDSKIPETHPTLIANVFRASIDGRAKRRPVNLELYYEARDA